MKKQAGFTFVEVAIVIVIMGILTAIGVPQLLQMIPNMRLRGAVRDLYSQMQNTKMSAIKNNTDWAIVFVPAANRYLVCSDKGADNDWAATADNTVVTTIDLTSYGSGVRFGHGAVANDVSGGAFPAGPTGNVSFTNAVLVFNSQGTATAGYAYLENQQQNSSYAVGTLVSGAIKILNWTGTAWR